MFIKSSASDESTSTTELEAKKLRLQKAGIDCHPTMKATTSRIWSYESDRLTCHTKISMTQGCLSTLLNFHCFYKLK